MKYFFVLFVTLVCIFGCSTIQQPLPNTTDASRDCAIICATVEYLNCWDDSTVQKIFFDTFDFATCFTKCNAEKSILLSIDVTCLQSAPLCDKIKSCINTN